MAGRWTVSTQIEFSASHSLEAYDGVCAKVHGHNWIVRAHYEFSSTGGNGLTVDFMELKSGLGKVILSRFDHVHLNDIPPFDSISPTSENIAAEIFRLCREELPFEGGRLVEIEIWETPTDVVRYRE
jgi:6-pyruvoyltetrahydropterin/6-carboxytetrahydropterin synthase